MQTSLAKYYYQKTETLNEKQRTNPILDQTFIE